MPVGGGTFRIGEELLGGSFSPGEETCCGKTHPHFGHWRSPDLSGVANINAQTWTRPGRDGPDQDGNQRIWIKKRDLGPGQNKFQAKFESTADFNRAWTELKLSKTTWTELKRDTDLLTTSRKDYMDCIGVKPNGPCLWGKMTTYCISIKNVVAHNNGKYLILYTKKCCNCVLFHFE